MKKAKFDLFIKQIVQDDNSQVISSPARSVEWRCRSLRWSWLSSGCPHSYSFSYLRCLDPHYPLHFIRISALGLLGRSEHLYFPRALEAQAVASAPPFFQANL